MLTCAICTPGTTGGCVTDVGLVARSAHANWPAAAASEPARNRRRLTLITVCLLLTRREAGSGRSTIALMARYTLVYGVRLVPEGSLKDFKDASLTLKDGTAAGITLHTIDGTIPQLRRAMDRSLDAFFDLLPGADEEDLNE